MVHALCNIFGRQFEAFLDENEVLPANGGPCDGRIECIALLCNTVACVVTMVTAICIYLSYSWKYVMIFLFCNTLACVVTAIILNIADRMQVS